MVELSQEPVPLRVADAGYIGRPNWKAAEGQGNNRKRQIFGRDYAESSAAGVAPEYFDDKGPVEKVLVMSTGQEPVWDAAASEGSLLVPYEADNPSAAGDVSFQEGTASASSSAAKPLANALNGMPATLCTVVSTHL